MKALIVDDIKENRLLLRTLLESQGYSVESAENGLQALDQARSAPPDLIISDLLMPEMDGYTLCRVVKSIERLSSIPFVFYTATYLDEEDEALALGLGASLFIRKPTEPLEFLRLVNEAVDEHRNQALPAGTASHDVGEAFEALHETLLTKKLDEKTRAVESLRKQQALILASTAEGILCLDLAGRLTLVNDAAAQMLGYQPLELHGRSADFLWRPSGPDAVSNPVKECSLQVAIQSGDTRRQKLDLFWRKDNSSFPVEYSCAPLLDEEGNRGTVIVFRDISDRNRAEQALRESETRLRTLVETMPDLVWLKDPDGRFLYCNRKFESLFGAKESEIIGQTDYDFVDRKLADLFRANDQATIEAGKPRVNEEEITYASDGHSEWVETIKSPVYGAGGELVGVLGIARDISLRKQSEAERERLHAQLLQAQKIEAVGQLAGGVAHDYNNALGVVIGYTELALKTVESTGKVHDYLQQALSAARRSANITRQLLAFARKQIIDPVVLDLNSTVEGMLKMLRHLIGENIDLAWLPVSGVWPLKIDPSQIDQILANLCVNARDAIADVGRVTIETENVTLDHLYCEQHPELLPGEFVMLTVSDNGCGMDRKTTEKIFEPFYTTKGVGRGTGLGLSTVFGIVRQNGGFINVYSEPGEGTTFKVYLPRHLGAPDRTESKPVAEMPKAQGETVLLVEDEKALLALGREMLEGLGYKVLTANTPQQAITLAGEYTGALQLLMTDVVMPDMNGRNLAEQIQALQPEIKTLFVSGYTANVIVHHGVLDKGVHFLQKPFSLNNLAVKVREALD